MNQKVVIAGSAKFQNRIKFRVKHWEDKGYTVIDYPLPIPEETFLEEYSKVHKKFFQNIIEADILFVMNEDKIDIKGYLGAESFAEMGFAVVRNFINNKNIEVMLLQMPEKRVQSYDELKLRLKLGWIKLYNE